MEENMREVVEKGYDEGDYEGNYRRTQRLNKREMMFFKKLENLIPDRAKIIDLGSGTGIPYDKYLVKRGYDVTGIDISSKHIVKAQNYVPEAKYIKADFSSIDLNQTSFDAVISLYAVFHIPRVEHSSLFVKIHSMLKDRGILLVTMGTTDMELDIHEFLGSQMAWSSYTIPENKKIIEEAGFKILFVDEEDEDPQEHHLWIIAQKE